MWSYSFLVCFWCLPLLPFGLPFYIPIPQDPCLYGRRSSLPLKSSNNDDFTEAIDSLQDFHVGQWRCSGALSFTISNDVAAGVLGRVVSPPYCVHVISTVNNGPLSDIVITETYCTVQKDITADGINFSELSESVERKIILSNSNFDIDSVDGSYSLDGQSLPILSILGIATTTSITDSPFFGIEHCIAVNDDARARCFLIYSTENEQLCRVVVCHETRNKTGSSEISSINELSKHDISLLELCSGVWIGDAVVRDSAMVQMSPISDASKKGFGSVGKVTKQMKSKDKPPLCSWTLGVQKFSWRILWNFDEEIRQIVELGRGMGARLENALVNSNRMGSVCPTPRVLRRTSKSERIVFIDWEDAVGFVCGCVAIYAPQYRKFDFTRRIRPFYTQFAVFQSNTTSTATNDAFSTQIFQELVCSKISRLYNYEGTLKQGVTSYSTLQRFDIEEA
jgi:hypothetical protein